MALKGDTVLEYLARFPNTSNLCLARIIYRDNVALFKDVEDARSKIRHYRGSNGNIARQKLTNRTYVKSVSNT